MTAVIAVIAAGAGYTIARGTASSPISATAAPATASPATPATGGSSPGMSMGGGGGSTGFSSPSLAQGIGRRVGAALAGKAPQTVSLARTRMLGDQVPGASGQGASTFTFQAGSAGTYQYICPMPGHAQMGMHGAFVVR